MNMLEGKKIGSISVVDKTGKTDVFHRIPGIRDVQIRQESEGEVTIDLAMYHDPNDPAVNVIMDSAFLSKIFTIKIGGVGLDCFVTSFQNNNMNDVSGCAVVDVSLRCVDRQPPRQPPPFMQIGDSFRKAGEAFGSLGKAASAAGASMRQAMILSEEALEAHLTPVSVPVDQQLVAHAGACHVCGEATRIRSEDGQNFEHVTCGGAS